MKIKLFLLTAIICFSWILYSGFSGNDDSPKWSQDPRTAINLNPEGQYIDLPNGTDAAFSNETRYISTPQGVFSVGPNFRVHPTSARTQSEVPITRHPQNPNIMFASANTFNVGGTTTFSCGHYVTTDGGLTFFGDDTTNFNFGDPAPMIMYTGRLLISYITSTGSMGAAYSVNNGATWSGTVTFPGATTGTDKNLSCTDGTPTSAYYGRCYTVYTEFAGAYVNRIVSTYSDDGGVTWSNVIPVSPVPSAGHHHQGCDVTVDIYGWVRVVFANCTSNGQNSTEDYLGWAESGTGGTSWGDVSDVKVNTNGIRTSDLLTSSSSIIRANGFPRIDGDKTCLSSADDEYVVMAEKNFAPALDNADIVLMKTPDGGSSWTRVRVNQNAAGSYEYFPAINVDATGGINVCYYSTRGIPTNDSARIYLSRSTDGGVTFTDVLISDHKFKPVPISGTAAGYQGDYIGITSGGAGKIIPYWCEQNTSTGGRYQAYASLVDISIDTPCEDFSCAKDTGTSTFPVTTQNFFEEFSGTNYWNRRSTASAYDIGAGSARFNAWDAGAGTTQSLISYQFSAAAANTYISFDVAYQPWTGGNVDSLIIETSSNSGTSYTILQKLWGGLGSQAGPLNTVLIGGSQFTPTGGQWSPRIYSLPVGTNKIKLRATSGFGNDIWLDNICVVREAPVANTVGLASEGMFIPANPYWRLLDSIEVYLVRSDFPNVKVDSARAVMSGNAVSGGLLFNRALTGNYYRVVKHRNSIETWSSVGTSYTRGATTNYNFIQPDGQAFGNNQAVVNTSPFYRGMYSGDINQNGFIDLTDVTLVYNDAVAFVTGYKRTDVTGDNVTDLTDLLITYNNNAGFVSVVRPPGATAPMPAPFIEQDEKSISFENEEARQKFLLTQKLLKEAQNIQEEKVIPNWSPMPPENFKKRNPVKPESRQQNYEGSNVGNP
ncbi:MAG: hypothetical protein IPL53_14040 [Ignavibacteria bacterium]|nr:hypothetical protein [Ignavibacteria bacterium]